MRSTLSNLMIKARTQKKLLYIDPDPVCHLGLQKLLESETQFLLSHSVTRFADSLSAGRVDVILLDIATAKAKGIASIGDLKSCHPDTPILVLTGYNESLYAERCLKAGASGFLMKTAPLAEIARALDAVAHGEMYVSDTIKTMMMNCLSNPPSTLQTSGFHCLSDRELLIVEQIGLSKNNKEIAQTLQISIKTIESHRSRIKAKLQLGSPQELMRYAMRMHFV